MHPFDITGYFAIDFLQSRVSIPRGRAKDIVLLLCIVSKLYNYREVFKGCCYYQVRERTEYLAIIVNKYTISQYTKNYISQYIKIWHVGFESKPI